MEAGFGVDSGRPTLRRGRPNSHFGCREHDDDDEHAVRRSLAHCCAPRRSTAVRRAVVAAAECRRPGPGQRQSGAAAAACPSRRSRHPGEGIVRPQDRAGQDGCAHPRLLFQGLPCRRRGTADQRRHMAGDALIAQPQLGASKPGAIPGTALRQGPDHRLAWSAGRRHVATARRPHAHRPCQPSGRSRR